MEAVNLGTLSINRASKQYAILRGTFQNNQKAFTAYLKKKKKKKTNSKKIQVMIALWVTWNAMDSQIELQQTSVEKECQLVKNSWHGILITLKEIWSWARKVRQ